jgi:chemotaxis protein MotB
MSTLALILFVLVLLAYVRSLVAGKQLAALKIQIDSSEQQLRELKAQIGEERAQLTTSQTKLREQDAVLAESSRQLDAFRAQLQSAAVLRVGVLEKLKDALEAELGPKNPSGTELVTIGDNGNVILNESLVFEYGSYAIKPEARPLLDTLARALGRVLADANVRANIDTILIQGHTDERGAAPFNWDLSAKRATAVLEYLFVANPVLADSYGSYFAASAYSKFRPLDTGKSEGAYQRNRRIEVSIVPRDDHVRDVIEDYLHNARTAPPAAADAGP